MRGDAWWFNRISIAGMLVVTNDAFYGLNGASLPLRISGVRKEQIKAHVVELLRWVGLDDHLDARPPTLSGGQQQRVAVARAVINRPSLLLADEPTGNIDDKIAMRVLYLFEELNKVGTTVVIATHNESLVNRFSYPRLHLADGDIHVVQSLHPRRG